MSTTLAPSSTVTARDPKGLKFISIVEAAYNKAGLSEEEAQRVNDTAGLAALIGTFIANNRSTDRYKDEEVNPRWGYPKSYKPGTVEQQIDLLRSHFPFIDPDPAIKYYREVYGSLRQPEWVEGPFVIMPTTTFKKHCFPDAEDAELLCSAVNLGIEKLGASRPFYNWCAGEITPDRFRRKARYAAIYDQLYATQPGSDLIIVGGQYGKFHVGQSMRRALVRMKAEVGELPAGALEGVAMALANPTRYSKRKQLDTDLPADEFRPDDWAEFSNSPYLDFDEGSLGFNMSDVDYPLGIYGAVSFSVPQSK